jgi:hypothetical protein
LDSAHQELCPFFKTKFPLLKVSPAEHEFWTILEPLTLARTEVMPELTSLKYSRIIKCTFSLFMQSPVVGTLLCRLHCSRLQRVQPPSGQSNDRAGTRHTDPDAMFSARNPFTPMDAASQVRSSTTFVPSGARNHPQKSSSSVPTSSLPGPCQPSPPSVPTSVQRRRPVQSLQ